jgi:hypothetical protein
MTFFNKTSWALLALGLLAAPPVAAQTNPLLTLDILDQDAAAGDLTRVHGAEGNGAFGVPLGGGFDCDGDGFADAAVAHMTANPGGRAQAGIVNLIFGDGTIGGVLDVAIPSARILRIEGEQIQETAGAEVWMDDMTGDGLGDLIICRQNYTPAAGREGAGAVTILVGGPELRDHAATLQPLLLGSPPAGIEMTTIVGVAQYDRFGIWARPGDLNGDGQQDLIAAADQTDLRGTNSGSLYVILGGSHFATSQTVDLAQFGSTPLEGMIARVLPPPFSGFYHFGSTCGLFDLDGNGRAEVIASAALARAGSTLAPLGAPAGTAQGNGGSAEGTTFILWDDNFPAEPWPAGLSFDFDAAPGSVSSIDGQNGIHRRLSEEIIGGFDFDGDGAADLAIGDLLGDATGGLRVNAGLTEIFYRASDLKGFAIDLDSPPPTLLRTTIQGPIAGAVSADTFLVDDFDGDGLDDIAIGNPHDRPLGRINAGSIHILYGRPGGWPAQIDLAPGALPPAEDVRIALILGAHGSAGGDTGDTLCYSGLSGDMDGDGRPDLIINEMVGNGVLPAAEDVGNLLFISATRLLDPPTPTAAKEWNAFR